MKAFAIDEFGQRGSVQELPDPMPEKNEVVVRVEAAGVNVVDVWVMAGALKDMMEHRFPLIPGVEASGVVAAIGSEVNGFAEGDRIYGVSVKPFFGAGTFAEMATLTGDAIAHAPTAVELVEASGIPHTALTALAAVEALGPLEGRKILVVGATGGVGTYLTQLAARNGATVIASARTENLEFARSLGAAETIDYTEGDLLDLARTRYPEGVDSLVDFFSDGPSLTRLSEAVRRGGMVLSASGGADAEILSQRGLMAMNINRASPTRLAELAKLIDAGELKVAPINAFALEEASSAISEMESRHVRGKAVIQPTK